MMATGKRVPVPARTLCGDPVCLLAFGLGVGLSPVAPGTFGTLLGVLVYFGLSALPAPGYGLAVGMLFAVGIPLCGACEKRLGAADHSGIVWDEIVGLLITLWGVEPRWQNVMLGFLFFRVFDILKPWPIRLLDRRLHGGLGIMLDDVLAGVFAWALLQAAQPWLP